MKQKTKMEMKNLRVYYYNLGKAVNCLYILNDTFRCSRDEITELTNKLFVIAEDVRRKIRGNSNGSKYPRTQFFKLPRLFLNGDSSDVQKLIFLKILLYVLDHWALSGTILQICFVRQDGPHVGE